jgi:hypothetical protein
MAFVVDGRLLVSLVVILTAISLIGIGALIFINYRKMKGRVLQSSVNLNSVKIMVPLGRIGVLEEIARLRHGGELNETVIRSLSAEDKALFEVALIESLTELPREEQHLLRATLVRHGYDEQCARRLMKGEISDRIRASTLLDLLRPQWQAKHSETAGPSVTHNSARARSAGSGSSSSHDRSN